ncbi:MAG: ABZJ_00895 family protein [Ascidiaceihabitans sp.]|nr:ABZJ_00895 family protein [Ascidiaceihabitans sp.]
MTEGYKIGYWRFSAWFLGLSIAIPAVSFALKAATGVELGQFAGTIIPMIVASMQEGVQFARGTKRAPSGKERLLIARMLTCIAIAWTSVLVFVTVLFAPQIGVVLMSTLGPAVLMGLILFMIAIFFFMAWMFVGMGAGNEMKLVSKDVTKDFE